MAVSLGIAACGGDDGGSGGSGSGGTQFTVALAAPLTAGYYPFIAANELGYFEEEGIEVEYVASDETPLQAFVANGNADISTPGANEAIFGASEGIENKVIFDPWTNASEGIAVLDDSPIQTMEDLEGKKIGLGTDEDAAFFQAAATEAGIDVDAVETAVVGEGGPTVVTSLQDGDIDAYGSTGNVFAVLEAQDIVLRDITPQTLKEASSVALITSPELIESESEALRGFLRATAKGLYAGQVDKEAITEMYRQTVPEDWRDEESAQATMDATYEFYEPVDDEKIGELFPERWQASMDRLLAAGELDEPIDIEGLLDPQFIDAANDWDRDVVTEDAATWLRENGE